jgi:hypothetical protein
MSLGRKRDGGSVFVYDDESVKGSVAATDGNGYDFADVRLHS